MTLSTVAQGVCQVAASRGPRPLNISYEVYGTGTQRVILIMGIGRVGKAWLPQVQFLAQHDFQACIFDNRGVGNSGNINNMAMDTIELLNHLGWTSDVHLIGTSMGGLIAQILASEYPQYFKSVCLTSTFIGIDGPENSSLNERLKVGAQLDPLTRAKQFQDYVFPAEWSDSPSAADPTKTNREFLLELARSIDPNDYDKIGKGYQGQYNAIATPYMTEEKLIRIRDSNLKVLVCTGDIDNLVPPANSEHIAKILLAPLKIFKGCGHRSHAQEADQYNDVLLEFICNSSV
ncbi:Alpha/Beta hydrolase protein [Syncephalis fuscata]|nr:Alpha/Beta hydrolase protein [Syncephalis fuscata]